MSVYSCDYTDNGCNTKYVCCSECTDSLFILVTKLGAPGSITVKINAHLFILPVLSCRKLRCSCELAVNNAIPVTSNDTPVNMCGCRKTVLNAWCG